MVRRLLFVVLVLGPISCTELPPPPGGPGGAGGSGGDGGASAQGGGGGEGGRAATAGTGGLGGSSGAGGAGGSADCAIVIPQPTLDTEDGDAVNNETKTAVGSVQGNCVVMPCTGNDPVDRWSITTCGGKHSIQLTWDEITNDLDLFLVNPMGVEIDDSSSQNTTSETIVADSLADGEEYIVQVQAYDVSIGQTYNLRVERLPQN